jgi:hypothetical protein
MQAVTNAVNRQGASRRQTAPNPAVFSPGVSGAVAVHFSELNPGAAAAASVPPLTLPERDGRPIAFG